MWLRGGWGVDASWSTERCSTYLHVLSQRRRVGVALVAAVDSAVVRLIGRVNVRVLLAVGGVGEASIAALVFAFEWFFACGL